MRELVRILCGSNLYGTNLPGSDRDFKIIYIPSARDILLQRGYHLLNEDQKDKAEASLQALLDDPSGKLDIEYLPIQRFVRLLADGHANAWDMVFAPKEAYLGEISPEWYIILNNAHDLISTAFGSKYLGSTSDWMRKQKINQNRALDGMETARDRKQAYHAIRLMGQFADFMANKKVVFPRSNRLFLKGIRKGIVPLDKMHEYMAAEYRRAVKATRCSDLPSELNIPRAEGLTLAIHRGELLL